MLKGQWVQNCVVCEGALESFFPEVRDPLTNKVFAIYRCNRCGLGHTIPQPEDLGPYYGSGYYGNRHGFMLRKCLKRRVGFVNAAVQPGKGKKLLDIGCGDGSFLLAAKEAGWEVMGTELNPKPARLAGLDVRDGIEEVPHDLQFDCVTMWHSLEHMRYLKSTLVRIARLLRPDGRLFIAVPDNGGFQAKIFRHQWLHIDVPRHLYHFDAASLKYCLASAGYSIERQWHQEFEYDLLGWSQSALNYVMPYPNVFFDCLTRKRKDYGHSIVLFSFVLGLLFSFFALPAVAAGTLLGRGGTLIAAARRSL